MTPELLKIIRVDFIEERVCHILADNLMTEQEALVCAELMFQKYVEENNLVLNDQ